MEVPEPVTPCVVLKEDQLSWSAVGCVHQVLQAPEGWVPRRGMKGLGTGTFMGPSRTLWGWGHLPECHHAGQRRGHVLVSPTSEEQTRCGCEG